MNRKRLLCFLLATSLTLSAPLSALAVPVSGSDVETVSAETVDGETGIIESAGKGYIPIDDGFVPERVTKAALAGDDEIAAELYGATGADSSYYNGVEEGIVRFEPYDQGEDSTCWAYATLEACRINAEKKGIANGQWYSVPRLAYYFYHKSETVSDAQGNEIGDYCRLYNSTDDFLSAGGNGRLAMWQLASWMGPSKEDGTAASADLTLPNTTQDIYLSDSLHVQNVYLAGIAAENRGEVKGLICELGSVTAGYYAGSEGDSFYQQKEYDDGHTVSYGNYYYNGSMSADHNIILIGWDDDYSKDNFVTPPSGDGAWLAMNSWGAEDTEVAQHGYFWISYEDVSLLGSKYVIGYDVEKADNYDHIYQYDGSFGAKTVETDRVVQLFSLDSDEKISALGIGLSSANAGYTAKVYRLSEKVSDETFDPAWAGTLFDDGGQITLTNGKELSASLLASKTGTLSFGGYHTVRLDSPTVKVPKDSLVAVVIDFSEDKKVFIDTEYVQSGAWNMVTGDSDEYSGMGNVSGTLLKTSPGDALRVKLYTDDVQAVSDSITFNSPAYSFNMEDTSASLDYSLTLSTANRENYSVKFVSADEDILTVDDGGAVTPVSVGGPVTVTATLLDGAGNTLSSATCKVTITDASELTGISIDEKMTLTRGNEKKLICRPVPSNITLPSVTWTSSNKNVASVDTSGNVSAVAVGTAVITARVDNDIYDTCEVTVVSPYTKITIAEDGKKLSSYTLKKGTSTVLMVDGVKAEDGNTISGVPVSWKTSDADIVTVNGSGKITAVNAGKATVTAMCDGYSDTCDITVTGDSGSSNSGNSNSGGTSGGAGGSGGSSISGETPVPPVNYSKYSIVITNREALKNVVIGRKTPIIVSTVSENGVELPYDSISFDADEDYVSVDEEGNLTGIRAGSGHVAVTASVSGNAIGKSFYVTVVPGADGSSTTDTQHKTDGIGDDVNDDPRKDKITTAEPEAEDTTKYVHKISLKAPKTMQISPVKGKVQVAATILPSNADNKAVKWYSSNPKYATVSQDGYVQAKKAGAGHTVVITCTAQDGSGVVGSIAIKVVSDHITKFYLTSKNEKGKDVKKKNSINAGKKMTISPNMKSTGKDIVKKLDFTSSNPEWVSVNSKGEITAYKEGKGHTVTITAVTVDKAKKATYKIYVRKDQHITVAKKLRKTVKIKASLLKKKTQKLSLKAKSDGNGKLSYEVIKCPKKAEKYISVSEKGVITLKKGAPKGTCKVTVMATQTSKYMASKKVVTIKVS